MLKTVKQTIAQYKMLPTGATVLVACSGGADSVALLLCLQELGYAVRVGHLHHGIRGAEADRDANFVRDLCQARQIPCVIERVDVPAYAKAQGLSLETAARQVRYAFLERVSAQLQTKRIATAHTASDNLETVVHHMLRGTGTRGLAGIPPVRGQMVRPLLAVSRAEVEGYLTSRKQDFVTDSTNASQEHTRNRIRQTVTPALLALEPQAESIATRMCALVRRDCDCLDHLAGQEADMLSHWEGARMVMPLSVLRELHPAIVTRILGDMMEKLGVPAHQITATHYAGLLKLVEKSGSCTLPAQFGAWSENGMLAIEPQPILPSLPIALDQPLTLWQTGYVLTVSSQNLPKDFNKTFNTFWVDCDTIDIDSLYVRTVQPQDRLFLEGGRGERQVKRLLEDYHVPRGMRAQLAVLADKNGIIAVQSIGIAQARTPTENHCYKIAFEGVK